jgi:hypothetical protein
LQVVKAAGITWTLARTWPGDRNRERQLKNQGGASRRCPACGIQPRTIPGQQEEKTPMKKPPDRSATEADRRPDYVIELWVSPELRDRAQHAATAQRQTSRTMRKDAAEPDPDPRLADREAEP